MRHLHAKFEMEADALQLLIRKITDFLRVGVYTLSEWETLADEERVIALRVRELLDVEKEIKRSKLSSITDLDTACQALQAVGAGQFAAKLLLDKAVQDLASKMNTENFAGALR